MTDIQNQLCVHELVQARAAAQPDRVAVVHAGESISYRELDARANRLAHRLLELGFRAPVVGLLLPRSAQFVVAALAVLKAGGSYVPLDADYPAERLRLMLDTAGCPVVLGNAETLAALDARPGVRTLAVDAPAARPDLPDLPDTAPAVDTDPDDLAYTMFTSGSTGTPKGVMITHRGIVRLALEPDQSRVGPEDVVLHLSSTSFDAATYDIWGALVNGARLVVAPAGRLSTLDIGDLLREHRVTTVLMPTGVFQLMVDERPQDLTGLRRLLAGGDVLSGGHAGRLARSAPDCAVLNVYGPTEITSIMTTHRVAPDQQADRSVPIGRAMSGTYLRVLDDRMEPVAAGSPGQLYAGGAGMARGYLNDPARTADRFVPDPWLAGARLYATGDLVRELPDGTLEFLNRMDDQFKKRGFRIEPGEVEAALRADPQVRDAVVLADGVTADTRRLVTVVLRARSAAGRPDFLDAVRARLRAALPEYLVPDLWAEAEDFPLTPNGKADRRALLDLAVASATARQPAEPADREQLSEEESVLASVWQDVLKLDRAVGREDDFFDLGGHSLLATRIVSQVRRRLDVSLPLDAVFDHPTVAALAAVVRDARHHAIAG